MMELSDNVTYMKLLHELKVIFPNLPDELVRQSIKKHGLDKTACSGALRILESQQISINHNYAPARFYPPEDNRVTTTPRISSSTGYPVPDRISGSTGSSSSTTTNKIQGDSYGLKQPSGPNQQLQGKVSSSHHQNMPLTPPPSTPSSQLRRPSSFGILPLGITYSSLLSKKDHNLVITPNNEPSSQHQPKVVLTPESPHSKISRTLYDPNGNSNEDSGLSMFGTTSTISATCIDIDMQSLSYSSSSGTGSSSRSSCSSSSSTSGGGSSAGSSENNNPETEEDQTRTTTIPPAICSVSTATYCRGNFRLLDQNGQSLASSAFTSLTCMTSDGSAAAPVDPPPGAGRSACCSSTSSTSTTLPKMSVASPVTNFILSNPADENNLLIQNNPYRKIFDQRKEFYERFSTCTLSENSEISSIKSGWQRLQENNHGYFPSSNSGINSTAISRNFSNNNRNPPGDGDVFTVKTNIEPFGPFVIEHNVKAPGLAKLKSDQMICLNPDAQDELRYATSHSGDGVESHIEVSLGKDGSIIKTRHHRLDGTQNSEENSILKLQYGEGGKVLEIQQTQSKVVPRLRRNNISPGVRSRQQNLRPNSAYCTHQGSSGSNSMLPHQFLVPRYNSMPNLDGRRGRIQNNNELGFNTHPADEEKRIAYTRALISHQMEQRQKLERRMLHTKNELQSMKCGVSNLTVLLEARTKFIQTGLVDVEVANELEEDVSSLQVRCDELQDELSLQVTQLTQGKVPLGEASIDFYESLPAVLNHSGITKADVIPPPITNNTNTSTISTTKSSSTSMPNTPLSSKVSKFLNKISTSCSSSSVLNNTNLQWSCSECTFLNHPALKMCEQCEMPRISSNFTEIQNQEQQRINDETNNKDCICHGVS